VAQRFTLISHSKTLPRLLDSPAFQKLQKLHSQKKERYTRCVHFWQSLFRSEKL